MLNRKPDQLTSQVITDNGEVGIRVQAGDIIRDMDLTLAACVVQELGARLAEALQYMPTAPTETSTAGNNERTERRGAGYSVLKWRREHAGSYVAHVPGGPVFKVYRERRGEWYAA